MARKSKQGLAKDLVDLVAMLPWWGCLALAVVSYALLHQLSIPPKAGALQPGEMGTFVRGAMVASFAYAAQFAAPVICLCAAFISFQRRRKREALLTRITRSSGADALNRMSWTEFEILVGEAFRLRGYSVTEQGGAKADGGVDLMLRKNGETLLVQCKQWKAFNVGVDVVRELYGVMAAGGAAGGFVVTSGRFTEGAEAFAHGRNITLVDGPKLFDMILQAKVSLGDAVPPAGNSPPTAAATAVPACPVCDAPMVRRTALKGSKAGAQFWGCSRFPTCRGTR